MSDVFILSERQMERIEPFFPLAHGVPRVDDPNDVLAAQDMRLATAELPQFGAHGGRNRRIHAHVGHEDVCVCLAAFN
ncbi:hypothetical protein ACE4RV_00825, partial [Acetobacter persici]